MDEGTDHDGRGVGLLLGWSALKGTCVPVWGGGHVGVLDSVEAKESAVDCALAAAETVMQIDTVVP